MNVCCPNKHRATEFTGMSHLFLQQSFQRYLDYYYYPILNNQVKKSNCHRAKMSHRVPLCQRLHKKLNQSIFLFFYFQTTHLLFVLGFSYFCYQH